LRFAEYFTRSFQAGTSKSATSSSGSSNLTSILALDGLFILMLDHQLEYPEYYSSLYQLLHPRILYTKQRARFLQLLSKSLLGNSMLPAYVVASFCKKLCRLALNGPPSGGLFALALVSNLLRKHGECACLIHRSGKREDAGLIDDVFVEDVDDLTQTRALESSLWELTALEKHYFHAISTVAKAVGTEDDKSTPMYDMDDFMAHTYKSLFEQEKKRLNGGASGDAKGSKKKSRVSLTFVKPDGLFTKEDVFGGFFKCS
jgi:U3 small nucleolar RNA-associated protein 19